MAASVFAVAAEIRRRLPGVPAKKLHKLLYYTQAHHAAAIGQRLFVEPISAWDMGPVVPALWRLERDGRSAPPGEALDEAQLNTVGFVVSRYGQLTGRDLENLTHAESPWLDADLERRTQDKKSAAISVEALVRYFRDDPDESTPAVDPVGVRRVLAGAAMRAAGRMPADDDPRDLLDRSR